MHVAATLAQSRASNSATQGVRRSDELRALVASIEGSAAGKEVKAERLAAWKAWVLDQAVALDPRMRSTADLDGWLGEFELGDASAD